MALARRFARQSAVYHPHDYALDDADRLAIDAGQAFFILGSVVAKVECVCRTLREREGFWYYSAKPGESVITDLILPKQEASSGYCHVDAKEVLKAGRIARKRGLVLAAAGHSHGNGTVFSSWTDRGQMEQQTRESVGAISMVSVSAHGKVVGSRESDGHREFDVGFTGCGCKATVRVSSAALGRLKPEDIDVRLDHLLRRTMSVFTTSNNRGKHYVPVCESLWCSLCGAKERRYLGAKSMTVHVVGPIVLGKEEKKALRAEVKEKVADRNAWWRALFDNKGDDTDDKRECEDAASG